MLRAALRRRGSRDASRSTSEQRPQARRYLGWRPCRFPTSSTAPTRSENPTPTPSCWRSRRSMTRRRPGAGRLARAARGARSPIGLHRRAVVVPARLRAREHDAARSRSSAPARIRMPQPCATRSAPASAPLTGFATVAVAAPLADDARSGRASRRAPPSAATASTATSPKRRSPARRASSCTAPRSPTPERSPRSTAVGGRGRARQGPRLDPRRVARARPTSPSAPPSRSPTCRSTVEVLDEDALARRRLRRHPRRRSGLRPAAAPGAPRLRARGRRAAPRARRQGHHLRHRRALAQARRRRWSA